MKKQKKEAATQIVARLRPQKAPVVQEKLKRNHFVFVVDASGSMARHAKNAQAALQSQLDIIREVSKDTEQAADITFITFDSDVDVAYRHLDVSKSKIPTIVCGGNTALYDAVKEAAEPVSRPADATYDVSYLIFVVTDGQENASRATQQEFENVIRKCMATDRYTFVWSVPDQSSADTLVRQGIPAGNILVWDTTNQEALRQAERSYSKGTKSYLYERSAGATRSLSYFQTDLSGVTKKDLLSLTDLTGHFRQFKVGAEQPIKEFIESKSAGRYRSGCAFYQLTKTEVVQATKNVLIREKNNKSAPIYGGKEARKLLGLPENGDVKLAPGNHGNYDVFVQSMSSNRKLVRGTDLLYEV